MKHAWRGSYAAKAATVVLTTVFLWGAGLSLVAVILEAANLFASEPAAVDASFVSTVAHNNYNDLYAYVSMSLPPVPEEDGMTRNYYADVESLDYFRRKYDAANTNLRFYATDESGAVILSNDSSYGENEEKLGTQNLYFGYDVATKNYQKQQHFDDYASLRAADMSSYLDDPGDFQIWYFTDDRVQQAYEQGVEVLRLEDPYTTVQLFDSRAAAESYDYEGEYGRGTTYEIMTADGAAPYLSDGETEMVHGTLPEASAVYDGGQGTYDAQYAAVIHAYHGSCEETVTLDEYTAAKQSDEVIYALDESLDTLLAQGFDVTITAQQRVTQTVTATVWLPTALPVNDAIRSNYHIFSFLGGKAEIITAAFFFFSVATILSAIAMCTAAGHEEGTDAIVIPSVHKLPYGFFWALPVAAIAGGGAAFASMWTSSGSWRVQVIFAVGIVLAIAMSCVLWLYTTAIRAKSGTFWSSFGIVRLLRAGFGLLRHKTLTCVLTAIAFTGLMIFNGVAAYSENPLLILPAIGMDLLALILILYCIYSYFTLHQHMRQITLGHFEPERYVIPLAGDFLLFDSELNTLTDSVGEMVARQMKAEHLRTELITNVSHDLKTPLTSIVNYVDLLSREPQQSDEAQEYLDVLRRQAARLKKLTTDLVDASKASTGNVTVEMQTTNVQVLLGQFAGEYDDKLQQSDLELVLSLPEAPVYILADGRLMMRIFDNLMNNACKYAMAGTRVYLDAMTDGQNVVITMKNVSAAPLNVSADELMERFVRGDSSRHTEGSGLGLSIARDLTALQGGVLALHTDGDLFKAVLTFPLYEPPVLEVSPTDL